ncbi:hypothetical protein ACFWDG_25335 [Peribacillus sp. NPDC060186]
MTKKISSSFNNLRAMQRQSPFLGAMHIILKNIRGDHMFSQYVQKLLGKPPVKTKPIIGAEKFGTLKSQLQKELFQPLDESKAFSLRKRL